VQQQVDSADDNEEFDMCDDRMMMIEDDMMSEEPRAPTFHRQPQSLPEPQSQKPRPTMQQRHNFGSKAEESKQH
jgi:hypothetical protein